VRRGDPRGSARRLVRIWPFFRDIVTEGETYAYPDDITAEQAQNLCTPGPDGFTAVAIDGDEVMGAP
jgi:hypothetical protein